MSKSYILSRMDWAKAYRDYEVLKVGKTNLLPYFTNSDFWSIASGWEIVSSTKLKTDSTGNHSVSTKVFVLKPNTDYTFTFNSDYARYYIFDGYTNNILRSLPTEGSDVVSFNSSETTSNQIRILISTWSQNLDKTRTVWELKLEEGKTKTPYTPTPEDINALAFPAQVAEDVKNLTEGISDDVFNELVDNAKLDWLNPVDSYDELPTDAEKGDTVMTREDGKVYRFNGDDWIEIQQIDAGPVNELDSRLSQRLDSTTQQLAEKAEKVDLEILDIEYGLIELPSDFPHTLPFDVTVVDENRIDHDFDIESYKIGASRVYLDWRTGHDTNNTGLSSESPVKTLLKALTLAESQSTDTVVIHIMNKYFTRNYSTGLPSSYSLTKNIVFSPYDMEQTYLGPFENPHSMSWSPEGTAYKAARTSATGVLDMGYLIEGKEPKKYRLVNSVSEVQAEQGTYYTDGASIWVRRMLDKEPNDELMVTLSVSRPVFEINDKKLVFDRTSFIWPITSSDQNGLQVTGNGPNSELVLYRAAFSHSTANGVATRNVKKVINVESVASQNKYDGFNYHGDGSELVYEYYVEAYDNGTNGVGNNNASTAHDGMSVLRIGTLGYRCDGPVIADVNGCYSICYNSVGHTSTKITDSPTKSGFYFNDSGAASPGKVILVNCGGGGKDTYSLSSDGQIEIIVKRFKGKNIHPNTLPTIQFS